MNVSSSSSSSSTTDYSRITGMVSGLDIDGLVKSGLSGIQTKIDKVKQDKQYAEWMQEAYVGVIKDLKDFQSAYLDILGSDDTNMMKSTAYAGIKASIPSDTTELNVSALPGAAKGNYSIKIDQLASGAKVQSSAISDTSKTLANLGITEGTMTITVDGKSFSITTTSSTSISDFITKLKSATDSNGNSILNSANISYSELTNKLTIESKTLGSSSALSITDSSGNLASKLGISTTHTAIQSSSTIDDTSKILSDVNGFTAGTTSITVDGKNFTVTTSSTDKISDFITKLQTATVTESGTTYKISDYADISYDSSSKKLTISPKSSSSSISISDTSGNVANKLGIIGNTSAMTGSALSINTLYGRNSITEITVPGETTAVLLEKNSNNFTIDNIKYSLQGETSDTVTVTVKADATDSVAKIKKFVDAYNTLIKKLNDKISEKKNLDYKPLTDAQKDEMTTDQITAWETKAKAGILRRESNISSLLSGMRQAIYSTVKGAGLSMTDIGITTTSAYTDNGKLQIDEDKLKTALENNSDQVQKLFTQSSTDSNSKGILQQFKDLFNANIGSDGTLIKKAGYENTRWIASNELYKSISKLSTNITDLQTKYSDKKKQLYNKYATLESTLNSLNTQSSWLSSQFS